MAGILEQVFLTLMHGGRRKLAHVGVKLLWKCWLKTSFCFSCSIDNIFLLTTLDLIRTPATNILLVTILYQVKRL